MTFAATGSPDGPQRVEELLTSLVPWRATPRAVAQELRDRTREYATAGLGVGTILCFLALSVAMRLGYNLGWKEGRAHAQGSLQSGKRSLEGAPETGGMNFRTP